MRILVNDKLAGQLIALVNEVDGNKTSSRRAVGAPSVEVMYRGRVLATKIRNENNPNRPLYEIGEDADKQQ